MKKILLAVLVVACWVCGCQKKEEPVTSAVVEEEKPTPYETLSEEELATMEFPEIEYPAPDGELKGTLEDLVSRVVIFNDVSFELGNTNISEVIEVFGEPDDMTDYGDIHDYVFAPTDTFVISALEDGTITGFQLYPAVVEDADHITSNLIPDWMPLNDIAEFYGIELDKDGGINYTTDDLSVVVQGYGEDIMIAFQKHLNEDVIDKLMEEKGIEHEENPFKYEYPGEDYDPDREEVQETHSW